MIIVSQPKNSIVNFDNITNMELEEYENKGWIIKCYTTDDHHINLAIYKTEKRAKEVLQEIINEYWHSCEIIEGHICSKLMFQRPIVYEMPEK